jgi:hypothetical protein
MGEDYGRYPKKECKAEIVLSKKTMYHSTEYSVKETTYFGVLSNVMFGDRIVQCAVISGHFGIISLSRIMARFLNYNYYLAEDSGILSVPVFRCQ